MAHYDVTYTCGHSEDINLTGPHAVRERRITYLESGVCTDCYKTQQHAAAKAEAVALELPPLDGTPNQIAWAETIRVTMLKEIERGMATLEGHADDDVDGYRAVVQAVATITGEASAHQWIEWRNMPSSALIRTVMRTRRDAPTVAQRQAAHTEQQQLAATQAQVLAAATVRPKSPATETVAEIRVLGDAITIHFPEKLEDFRSVVKALGYTWTDGHWTRTVGRFNGPPADRAAEAGHALLAAHFAVCILDDTLRAKAISGTYAPECTRWIRALAAGDHVGWFTILWGRGEDYYDAARRITRSQYAEHRVVVPPEQFAQILDFAQLYDFHLSDAAQALVDQARAARATMTVIVAPRKRATPQATVPSDVPPVLVVPETVAIADELRDQN